MCVCVCVWGGVMGYHLATKFNNNISIFSISVRSGEQDFFPVSVGMDEAV